MTCCRRTAIFWLFSLRVRFLGGARMLKRALGVPIAVIALFVVGSPPALAAIHKDPDITANPAAVQSIVAALVAPDVTIGDTDTAAVGVGSDAVGIDSLTNPPADPADSSPGTTFFVSKTPDPDCSAAYPTIQAAVIASGPGDTVKVCPGTYQEHVNIIGSTHNGLKLESLVPLQAIIKYPIDFAPATLVDINGANNVTIRSFTITGRSASMGAQTTRTKACKWRTVLASASTTTSSPRSRT